MNLLRPVSTRDLLPSERCFLNAMRVLGFGRFESLQIRDGEWVLDPWPTTVRDVKFGAQDGNNPGTTAGEFALKQQVAELFEHIRNVEAGEIRTLEIRHGLPFAMEVELEGTAALSPHGGGDA